MPQATHITPEPSDVLLLVGTMKGAFILRSNAARGTWDTGGPYFPGHAVYAMAYDRRAGRRRLWAGPNSMHFGGMLRSSDDFGRTWTNPEQANVKFPEGTDAALQQIWQVVPGRDGEPDTLYCGVEPAALFVSRDAGDTWSLVEGLWNHPQRARWQPGGGGLCLHTVLLDPERLERIRIAVSTGGMYVTDDGGATWRPSNKGVRADFLPDKQPEFGQCVHKVTQSRQRPDRMFLQNHWGLYRSDDRGETWTDIANGVPSDFGFPIVAHPADPDCAW
ncbi:MAG TPA: sialidase family protein, partial [Vicinamibacterales bacterium]